jgi:NitT/TauT family transport system substrate-binding protein
MKKRYLTFLLPFVLLASCNKRVNNNDFSSLNIISPVGAPSATMYSFANDTNFETNSNVTLIETKFLTDEYDVIIMDHTRGIKQITNNNADFKLARIITKGNLFLVGINKAEDEVPNEASKIVTFGSPAAITNQVLTKIYPFITEPFYVNSVTEAGSVLKLGKYDTLDVDYVLMAEPLLFSILHSADDYPTKGKLTRIISLQDEWKNLTGFEGYPQAGLFISNKLINDKKDLVTNFLAKIDENITNLIENPSVAVDALNNYGTLDDQKARFGVTANVLNAMQKDNQNRLGYTDGGIDVDAFEIYMGRSAYPSDVYASFYK